MMGNNYQQLAARTINKDLNKVQLVNHAVLGMNSEAGEIAGIFQKVYQGHEADEEHIKKELGDLLWFVAEMCTAYDWKLNDIMKTNIEKLIARFPDGFQVDKSLHRREGDI